MKEEPKIIPNVPVCKLLKLADQGIKANQEKRFSIRELYKELCKLV